MASRPKPCCCGLRPESFGRLNKGSIGIPETVMAVGGTPRASRWCVLHRWRRSSERDSDRATARGCQSPLRRWPVEWRASFRGISQEMISAGMKWVQTVMSG